MVSLTYDASHNVLVAFVTGATDNAANERLYAAVESLDRAGKQRNGPIAMMLLLAPDAEPLNAHWRKRFADQRKNLTAPRAFLSVITQSAMLRGVMTAMNWINQPPAHIKSQNHATFEESAAWIELCHGTPRAVLRRLLDDVSGDKAAKSA
jgi:hypothetical protein